MIGVYVYYFKMFKVIKKEENILIIVMFREVEIEVKVFLFN